MHYHLKAITLSVGILGLGVHTAPAASAAELPGVTALGNKVAQTGSLRDIHANLRSLQGFTGHPAIVLAFMGTDCPISNLYLPGLIGMEKRYRSKKVQFLAIYPNENEDLDQIAAHAYDHDVPFPVLKDCEHRLADSLGVSRVPTVVVLDGNFALRYRGRINDCYGVAFRKSKATREDLAKCLDELLAGKPVSVAETEADGCLLDRTRRQPAHANVTYNKQIARIVQNHCQTCHRPDQAAPFSLLTYDEAVRHGRMIKEVTLQHRMPPWHADPRYGKFANDRRLTQEEIDALMSWVDAGMPRGEDKDFPRPIDWTQGWTLGKPDLVVTMPEEFQVPAEGALPYKTFTVETGFKEDRWVRLAEARPGARAVVHHLVVYVLKEGQQVPFSPDGTLAILVGWAPGDLGLVCPPDTALRIPKGSRLQFELHYTPNGKAVKDRSSIGITFAKKPPRFELFTNSFANESIMVPPHDPHYRAEATLRLRADARIISFVPHMHWRGKDYRYEAIYPDGKRETLLSVPRWDFNWQNVYQLEEPIHLPKGSRIYSVAHWDNSANNPYNPAPDRAVRFGLQTWDEMMVGWVAYVWERPETAKELATQKVSRADLLFDRLDRNGDEVITPDEIPLQMRPLLLLQGGKLPQRMTRQEFGALFEEMAKRMQRNRPKKRDTAVVEKKSSKQKSNPGQPMESTGGGK